MKVTSKLIQGVRALTYTYSPCREAVCEFHLLSEVGEPWQKAARRQRDALALRMKCEVKTVELPAHPWLVDALV